MPDLDRFRDAQDRSAASFDTALAEIRAGGKRSHWIWYIFPQLAGLGRSPMAQAYAIHGVDEAVAYLRDPVLGPRLVSITKAVADRVSGPDRARLDILMGSEIDAQKLVSSLTLFGDVAKRLHAAEALESHGELASLADAVLAAAEADGYPPCRFTLDTVRAVGPGVRSMDSPDS